MQFISIGHLFPSLSVLRSPPIGINSSALLSILSLSLPLFDHHKRNASAHSNAIPTRIHSLKITYCTTVHAVYNSSLVLCSTIRAPPHTNTNTNTSTHTHTHVNTNTNKIPLSLAHLGSLFLLLLLLVFIVVVVGVARTS